LPTSIRRLRNTLLSWIWSTDYRTLDGPRRTLVASLRMGHALLFVLMSGHLPLLAMSLVYTTLVSLVPFMAVTFSILKVFGAHLQALPLLTSFLKPLGAEGEAIAPQLIRIVENIDVGLLGILGTALLVYMVVSLLHKVEAAINSVWQVSTPRRFGQRFSNYLSIIFVGPILVFGAIGITALVMNTAIIRALRDNQPFGLVILWGTKIIPYLLVWAAFTFLYILVPNVRVRLRAAVIGGLSASVLWQTSGWAFASFIVSSGRYTRIYSSLTILILGLLWLYLHWLILLLGAQIAYFLHTPRRYLLHPPVPIVLSNRLTERLALTIMYLVARSHHDKGTLWTLPALADHLDVPAQPVERTLELLRVEGWIIPSDQEPAAWLPARDTGGIHVAELITSVRRAGESTAPPRDKEPFPVPVEEALDRVEKAGAAAVEGLTLRDLVLDHVPEDCLRRAGPIRRSGVGS